MNSGAAVSDAILGLSTRVGAGSDMNKKGDWSEQMVSEQAYQQLPTTCVLRRRPQCSCRVKRCRPVSLFVI
jgi:hypothetical protein